MEDVVLEG